MQLRGGHEGIGVALQARDEAREPRRARGVCGSGGGAGQELPEEALREGGHGDFAGGAEALGCGVEDFSGRERADEPRVGDRFAGAVVDVFGVAPDCDSGGAGRAVDGV